VVLKGFSNFDKYYCSLTEKKSYIGIGSGGSALEGNVLEAIELARFLGTSFSINISCVNNAPPSDLCRLWPSGTGGGGRSGRGKSSSTGTDGRGRNDEERVGGAGGW